MAKRDYPDYAFTSFSRLGRFKTCPKFYQKKYLERQKTPFVFNPATTIGTWTHAVLEEVLSLETNTLDATTAYALLLPGWLKSLDVESLLDKGIFDAAESLGSLAYKASERYVASDKIRTTKGSAPKDVWNYPPASWTSALKQAGLQDVKYIFDNYAASLRPDLFIQNSLVGMLAEVYSFICDFKCPTWATTKAVEMPISTDESNKILMPGQKDLYINLFIDWVITRTGHDDQVFILDFKSDSKVPTELDVLHHPQLNLYCYCYETLYGIRPYGQGIFHIPSGKYILTAVDIAVQAEVMESLGELQAQIDIQTQQEQFYRCHPNDYGTPCKKANWETGVITEVCPFLKQCWPTYHQVLSNSQSIP